MDIPIHVRTLICNGYIAFRTKHTSIYQTLCNTHFLSFVYCQIALWKWCSDTEQGQQTIHDMELTALYTCCGLVSHTVLRYVFLAMVTTHTGVLSQYRAAAEPALPHFSPHASSYILLLIILTAAEHTCLPWWHGSEKHQHPRKDNFPNIETLTD